MKNPFSTRTSSTRILEDQIYEKIGEEIASGKMDMAAHTRAVQEGGDDDGEVKKAYIKYRFSRLQAEQDQLHQVAAGQLRETQKLAEQLRETQKLKEKANHQAALPHVDIIKPQKMRKMLKGKQK